MKFIFKLFAHLMVMAATLLGPGGVKAVVAPNLLLKQQLLLLLRRRRQRAPNLGACKRALLGFWALFLNPQRILRSAIVIKPSTLLRCHAALEPPAEARSNSPRTRQGSVGGEASWHPSAAGILCASEPDAIRGCGADGNGLGGRSTLGRVHCYGWALDASLKLKLEHDPPRVECPVDTRLLGQK